MATFMDVTKEFYTSRLSDLSVAQEIILRAYTKRSLPSTEELPLNVALTALTAFLLANVLLFALTAKGRKFVLESAEAVLAVILIILLLVIVLGLPVGKQIYASGYPTPLKPLKMKAGQY